MTARQLHRITPLWPTEGNDQSGPPTWTRDAPCRRDPDLWFSEDPEDVEAAKAACLAECPLERVIACMDYAFDNEITWGVWGGVSSEERVEKRCADCGETKALGEFQRDQSADGRRTTCKPCANAATRRAWAAKRDEANAKAKRDGALAEARQCRTNEAQAREATFAQLRVRGMTVTAASAALSMTPRNGQRYEVRRIERLSKQGVAA